MSGDKLRSVAGEPAGVGRRRSHHPLGSLQDLAAKDLDENLIRTQSQGKREEGGGGGGRSSFGCGKHVGD